MNKRQEKKAYNKRLRKWWPKLHKEHGAENFERIGIEAWRKYERPWHWEVWQTDYWGESDTTPVMDIIYVYEYEENKPRLIKEGEVVVCDVCGFDYYARHKTCVMCEL